MSASPEQQQQQQQKQPNFVEQLNLDYFKTPIGQLRVAQGVLSLAALISLVEGQCRSDAARFGFVLCVLVLTMVEAIFIIIVFLLKLDKKVSQSINIPLTFLMKDSISLVFYFINCNLSLLSIGRCRYRIEARVITALFIIALFLVYIGSIYKDYKWWQKDNSSKEMSNNGSTTVTESSPTVLT